MGGLLRHRLLLLLCLLLLLRLSLLLLLLLSLQLTRCPGTRQMNACPLCMT